MIEIEQWLRDDGIAVIPCFTSPEALYRAMPNGSRCAVMPVRYLFESCPNLAVQVNPRSDCTLVLFPELIIMLMAQASAHQH